MRLHAWLLAAIVVMAALAGVQKSAAAVFQFRIPAVFAIGSRPTAMAVANLDGTGGLDVALVRSNGALSLIPGDGAGDFGDEVTLLAGGALAPLVAADLDGDGAPDLVCGCANPSGVSILLHSGGTSFSAPIDVPLSAEPGRILAVDLDGDNRLDLVVWDGGHVDVVRNLGRGSFASATTLEGPLVLDMAVGRFDGDAGVDIVGSNADSPNALQIWHGHGDCTFDTANTYLSLPHVAVQLLSADLDGNGDPDLIAVNGDASRMSVAMQSGGIFGPWTAEPAPGGGENARVGFGDLDGDCHPDIVVLHWGNSYSLADDIATVLLGRPDGSFVQGPSWRVARNPDQATIADVNDDGHPDMLAIGAGIYDAPSTAGVQFVRGGPGGSLEAPQWLAYGPSSGSGQVGSIHAARLVAGHRRDLLVATRTDSGWLPIVRLPGQGYGVFGTGIGLAPVGQLVSSLDLDHDGVDDILVVLNGSNIETWFNDGTAHFTLTQSFASPPPMTVGDLDGDELSDLWFRGPDGSLQIRFGHADGTFGPPLGVGLLLPPSLGAPLAADLDGDGRAEFACTVPDSINQAVELHVYRNLGSGFAPADSCPIPIIPDGSSPPGYYQYPVSLAPADVNGDGRRDLALLRTSGTDPTAGGVETFVRQPDGTYMATIPAVYTSGTAMGTGDFDGDGRDDIVITRADGEGTDQAVLFRSSAEGSPVLDQSIKLINLAEDVVTADFDDDGRPDLAALSPGPRVAMVVRNSAGSGLPTPALVSLEWAEVVNGCVRIAWLLEGIGRRSVTIERGQDGGWIPLESAFPDGTGHVSYDDRDVEAGSTYAYRLSWVQNGQRVTSAATFVTIPATTAFVVHLLGSPASDATLAIETPAAGALGVALYDLNGRRMAFARVEAIAGANRVRLTGDLGPGLYFVRATLGGRVATARLVIAR